jgi:hypothetical protein
MRTRSRRKNNCWRRFPIGASVVIVLFPLFFSAQVINIESKRFLNDTNGFVGRADLNFNLAQNAQQIISLGTNVHMQYQHNKHRFLAISDLAFIKAGPTDFVNNGYQHLRYGYKIIDRLTWESFVQAQYNLVLKLDKRYLAGMGPRVKIFKKKNFRLYVAALYMYEYQLQDKQTIEQYNHRLSSYVTFNIGFNKFDFSHTTFFQPLLTDLSNYRIASDSNLDIVLTGHLNFRVGFNLLYDNHQPLGVPDLVYVLKNGLSFKF